MLLNESYSSVSLLIITCRNIWYISKVLPKSNKILLHTFIIFLFRNLLKTREGDDMWVLPDQHTGFYNLELKLPPEVKCEQCILQVDYIL